MQELERELMECRKRVLHLTEALHSSQSECAMLRRSRAARDAAATQQTAPVPADPYLRLLKHIAPP